PAVDPLHNAVSSLGDRNGLLQLTCTEPLPSPVTGSTAVPAPKKAPPGAICAIEVSCMNMNSLYTCILGVRSMCRNSPAVQRSSGRWKKLVGAKLYRYWFDQGMNAPPGPTVKLPPVGVVTPAPLV